MFTKLRWRLAKWVTKGILFSVTEDDVVRSVGVNLYRGDEKLSPGARNSIITGSQAIKDMEAYKVIMDDLKYTAGKRIQDKALTGEDVFFARGGLWIIQLMEKKVENLSRLK